MRLINLVAITAITIGLGFAAHALSMPAKAWLGQRLISHAFTNGGNEPPWSWADFRPQARIFFPRLGASVVALSSASGEAMAWGPGLIEGSAESSDSGTVAYAGHRDSHFQVLGQLRLGDEIFVESASGEAVAYQVVERIIVDSRTWQLPVKDVDRLALTTCWPIDASKPGPMRLVILADRTEKSVMVSSIR